MNPKQRILALVDLFTADSGRIQHKQFKDCLQNQYLDVYTEFVLHRTRCKKLNINDLRAQCLSFSNGFTVCRCGAYTRYNPHLKDFTTYCGPKCSNSDPIKKQLTAKRNLKKYGCTNAANAHKVGYAEVLSKLTTSEVSKLYTKSKADFAKFYLDYSKSSKFKQDEAALLTALLEYSRSLAVWYVNLNHTSSRIRLQLATGEIKVRPSCKHCQSPVGNTWYAFVTYCSTTCSNQDADNIASRNSPKHVVKWVKRMSDWRATMTDAQRIERATHNAKNRFKRKDFQFNGKLIQVQGYEGIALDYLVAAKLAKADDLKLQTDTGFKVFKYELDGKMRTYLPDFYIPKQNRVVEVKSAYTLAGYEDIWRTNCTKAETVMSAGFEYSMLVFTEGGERIKLPTNWFTLSFRKIRNLVY